MKIKVVYHSNTGNTQKIAEALAEALHVTAEPMSAKPEISGLDILFVGGSLKMFNLERHCAKFFRSLNKPGMAKNVVIFSTCVSGKGILNYAQKMIKAKDMAIYKDEYKCLGNYYKDPQRVHPDENDCIGAKEFAATVLKELAAG
jgi:flavodoxin